MPACPECHLQKGLYSNLSNDGGVWKCSVDTAHKFTRDELGYLHSVQP